MKPTKLNFSLANIGILVILYTLLSATTARSTVLTFDDIIAPGSFGGSYQGFELNNSGIFNANNYWAPGAVSGSNILYNYNSRIGEISNANSFDFNGAYFTADARYGYANVDVTVSGYDNNGLLLATQSIALTNASIWFDFNWAGVSKITWDPTTPTSVNIAIDNFTYNNPIESAPAVPEPTTIALLGLGIFFLIKRKF